MSETVPLETRCRRHMTELLDEGLAFASEDMGFLLTENATLRAELDAQTAEIEKLREALMPFALAANGMPFPGVADDEKVYLRTFDARVHHLALTQGDFRRAATLLGKP